MTAIQIQTSASVSSPTDGWLVAWTLTHSGFPCVVAIGDRPAESIEGHPAKYALHLAHALPIATLIAALRSLSPRRPAMLLTTQRVDEPPYRERLQLDNEARVLS